MAPNNQTLVEDFEYTPLPNPSDKKKLRKVRIKNFHVDAEVPEHGWWHYNRKKEILKRHPEIAKLSGHNPWSFPLMLVAVAAQTSVAILLSEASWTTFWIVTYFVGAYLSVACTVLAHEGAHGLVFESAFMNKMHNMIAFLPVFIAPFATFWMHEHSFHHQVVVNKIDLYGSAHSLPLYLKVISGFLAFTLRHIVLFFTSLFCFLRAISHRLGYSLGLVSTPFPEAYLLRPYNSFPQVPRSPYMALNIFLNLLFQGTICYYHGPMPLLYFFFANSIGGSTTHPLGMRQIQEHYIKAKHQPTYSIYTSFNPFVFNIGYHVEHHDFPSVPWNRLPLIKKMAPEFYDPLFSYSSYFQVCRDFFSYDAVPFAKLLLDD